MSKGEQDLASREKCDWSVEGMGGAVEVCELDLYESPVSGVIAEANGVIAQGRCSLPGGSH